MVKKKKKIKEPKPFRSSVATKVTRKPRADNRTVAKKLTVRKSRKAIPVIEEAKYVADFSANSKTVESQLMEGDVRNIRQAEVARMYLQDRYTASQIAKVLGVGAKTVRRDLETLRTSWKEKREGLVESLIDEEITKLDFLEKELWDNWKASKKQSPDGIRGDLGVIKQLLSVASERRKIIESERKEKKTSAATGGPPINWIGVIVKAEEGKGSTDKKEVGIIDVN